jgi:hypothetical protein
MATSDGIASHGTLIARQVGGGAFTTIGELFDVTPPPLTRPSTEITPHNDNIDSYVIGVRRRGELALVINFLHTDTSHDETNGLLKAWADASKDGYRITYLDGTTWIFSGYCINVGALTPGREGGQQANVTIRPSGAHKIDTTEWE